MNDLQHRDPSPFFLSLLHIPPNAERSAWFEAPRRATETTRTWRRPVRECCERAAANSEGPRPASFEDMGSMLDVCVCVCEFGEVVLLFVVVKRNFCIFPHFFFFSVCVLLMTCNHATLSPTSPTCPNKCIPGSAGLALFLTHCLVCNSPSRLSAGSPLSPHHSSLCKFACSTMEMIDS